ncbi:FAR1-related sequence 1 [Rhynchospora pubera]|uniref:Protein FAR1-RELATED SEQUENCE n=1 Tax=Rhynchospora pubera TaxID=906938 RepID=A0AAV8CM82_9POAL|nr:FAR1-related sequence 1 [Rhynchospora pubera]
MTSPEREREDTPPANPVLEHTNEDGSKEENNNNVISAQGGEADGGEAAAESTKQVIEVPEVGLEFDTEQEAYDFYKYYGWKMGFGVRREYGNKCKKTGEITSRKFTCSREGFKTLDKRVNHTKPTQPDTRTGCKAYMIIRRKKTNNKLEVIAFNPEHNHPLITCANPLQKKVIDPEAALDNGSANKSFSSIVVSEPEPPCEIMEPVYQPHKNLLSSMRPRAPKYGEISRISHYFQTHSLEDPLFFHAFQFDVEERVTNVFWADAKMIMDYGHFGDVVAFDIASRSHAGCRPFVSFVGFNHYAETILFGAGFLYDESLESFKWLFETFLQAMSDKKPRTILTHQDPVMARAIAEVMPLPDTYHALCVWHIKETAKRTMAHLFRGGCDFKKEFKACINDYEEEVEFLSGWNAMVDKYSLHNRDNEWLQKLFEDKEKWARPYVKWVFRGGMTSTQSNDQFHNELKEYLKNDADITTFFRHYERVVNNRRYKELEGEFSARLKLPYFKIKAPILAQVSEIYTYIIFQLFQEEYEEFQSCYIVNRDESAPMREYLVGVLGKNGQYKVYGNPSDQTVSCSCRKFETHGFLCSHALKILDSMDVKHIPDCYLLKRWSKRARDTLPGELEQDTRVVQTDTTMEVSSRYKHLCPKFIKLVNRASECEESFRQLDKHFKDLNLHVEDILRKQTSIDATMTETSVHISLSGLGDMDRGLDGSGSRKKKKMQKAVKPQYRSCIEKGLHKRRKMPPEQPPPTTYAVLDPATPPGNVLFQVGIEVPTTVQQVGAHAQAYKQYKGIDLSSPLGPMGYDGMHSGLNAGYAPPVLRDNITFTAYHHPHPQGSHNQLQE